VSKTKVYLNKKLREKCRLQNKFEKHNYPMKPRTFNNKFSKLVNTIIRRLIEFGYRAMLISQFFDKFKNIALYAHA